MSLPSKCRAYRRTADGKAIELVEESVPQTLGASEVLIKIHAVSLNFRDIAMLDGRYPVAVKPQGVPCSDAAATVVAVGDSVKSFEKGDYVTPSFLTDNVTGMEKYRSFALGGEVDGVLREYAVFDERVLTKIPSHLSYEEGSTIACAGVTAWTALDMDKKIPPESALMQGTGGVSMFALLICLAAGIKPVMTSSSDEKLNQLKVLGTDENPVLGINYRTNPDWDEEARKLTDGGVGVVVNNEGPSGMQKCISALCAFKGTVSLVGFLGGITGEKMPDMSLPLMMKCAKAQGIGVGSTKDQQDLCNFLAEKKVSLKPVIDKKIFDFEESPAAFDYLNSGKMVGKVVIKL